MNSQRNLAIVATFVASIFSTCRPEEKKPAPPPSPVQAKTDETISLFITTQMQNTPEPCGCSSEPLGDIARIAGLVRAAGDRGLWLDAGGLRYKPVPPSAEKQQQARLTADFLETTLQKFGAAVMLGPSDVSGKDGLAELAGSVRVISNLDIKVLGAPAGALVSETVRTVAGVKVGVLGVADKEAPWLPAVAGKLEDPTEAAKAAVARLKAQGAEAVVALAGMKREGARRLARKVPGIDLVVVGADAELEDGLSQAEQVGTTLLSAPAIWGQRILRVDLHLGKNRQPVWTLKRTAEQEKRALAAAQAELAKAEERLAKLRSDKAAEPEFVKTSADEVERKKAELAKLGTPAAATSGYVTVELVAISRRLSRDKEVADAMAALDRRVGEANLQALSAPPPPPPKNQPSYVGIAGCAGSCHFHDEAIEFWQKTRHAKAFPTLVEVGKDLSYECVSCHAVGFDEAGGSNLFSLSAWQDPKKNAPPPSFPDLRNVQCEVCHGPGSLHVRAPSKNRIPIAKPSEDRCLTCHNKLHSDTFDFVPYLRDILGSGHGAARRIAIGEGPTGQKLRSAAQKLHAAP